jgi:hypothetical protein
MAKLTIASSKRDHLLSIVRAGSQRTNLNRATVFLTFLVVPSLAIAFLILLFVVYVDQAAIRASEGRGSRIAIALTLQLVGLGIFFTHTYLQRVRQSLRMKSPIEALEGSKELPFLILRPFEWEDAIKRYFEILDAQEIVVCYIKNTTGCPCIVVAPPRSRRRNFRAPELHFDESIWRDRVGELMTLAAGIVIFVGDSDNIWWELCEAIKRVNPLCLAISFDLVPKDLVPQARGKVMGVLGRPVEEAPEDIKWILFDADWRPSFRDYVDAELIAKAAPKASGSEL